MCSSELSNPAGGLPGDGHGMGGGEPLHRRVEARPSKTRMPDEMKVREQGRRQVRVRFRRGGRDGRGRWERPTGGLRRDPAVGEGRGARHLDRPAQERRPVAAQGDVEALEGRQDAHGLFPRVRVRRFDGVSMDYIYQRIGGGSGFAGDWRSIRETMNSPFPLQVKAFQGDGLSIITVLEKKTQNVKFDGKDYPNEGPGGGQGATSSAQRVDERTLAITDKVNGKVTDTERIGLSADPKNLRITVHVPGSDKPNVMVFERK